jgi:hypothetical protein
MKWSPRVVLPAAVGLSVLLIGHLLFLARRFAPLPPFLPAAETPQQAAFTRDSRPQPQPDHSRRGGEPAGSPPSSSSPPRTTTSSPRRRKIFLTATITDQARQVVKELIDGPHTALLPTIPATAEVREVYLADGGTVYVDFSKAFVDAHPGGSSAEISTIFSLVDNAHLQFPGDQESAVPRGRGGARHAEGAPGSGTRLRGRHVAGDRTEGR